jgi:hypothetical protein
VGRGPAFRDIHGDVYAIGSDLKDERGDTHRGWFPITSALNRMFFTHPRAWAYVVIGLGPNAVPHDVTPDLAVPRTEPPHTEHATHPPPNDLIAARGAEKADLRAMMADQDDATIPLTHCHDNPTGHIAVAAKLADWTLAQP